MKHLILILALLIASPVFAGDVLDMTAETTPAAADIMYLIKSPGGTGLWVRVVKRENGSRS